MPSAKRILPLAPTLLVSGIFIPSSGISVPTVLDDSAVNFNLLSIDYCPYSLPKSPTCPADQLYSETLDICLSGSHLHLKHYSAFFFKKSTAPYRYCCLKNAPTNISKASCCFRPLIFLCISRLVSLLRTLLNVCRFITSQLSLCPTSFPLNTHFGTLL